MKTLKVAPNGEAKMTNIAAYLTKKGWAKVEGIVLESSVELLTSGSKPFAAINASGRIAFDFSRRNIRYFWRSLAGAMKAVSMRSYDIYNDDEPGRFSGVYLLTPAGVFKAPLEVWQAEAVASYKAIVANRKGF